MKELNAVMQKFAASGWDLIAVPRRNGWAGKPIKTFWHKQSNGLTKNVEAADVN